MTSGTTSGTSRRWCRRRIPQASVLLAFFLSCGLSSLLADEGVRPSPAEVREVPHVGLTADHTLGLPGVESTYVDRYRYSYHLNSYWRPGVWNGRWYRRWYSPIRPQGLGWYGGGYYPWDGAPQTQRRKIHRPPIYYTPRLGLHYLYPDAEQMGLQTPPEEEVPVVPAWPDPAAVDISPAVVLALDLFKARRYAEAGSVLSDELKDNVASIETYVVISELLVATGKFASAASIISHGVGSAEDLTPLDGLNIAYHFPSPELFETRMAELAKEVETRPSDRLKFLHAAFRVLSGDTQAMDELESLQDSAAVARPARRLYLHFVDRLFDDPVRTEAAAS